MTPSGLPNIFLFWAFHYGSPTGFAFAAGVGAFALIASKRWQNRCVIGAIVVGCLAAVWFTATRDPRLPSPLGYGTIAFAIGYGFSFLMKGNRMVISCAVAFFSCIGIPLAFMTGPFGED